MTRRLFVHVGLQKTGTSYLQGVMESSADRLSGRVLDLVPDNRRDAFELMLLVRGRFNPDRDRPSTAAALDRFAAALAAARAPAALLSQESLAAARPAQVRTLLDACGDREVHVVATVRDVARQVPSSWQQELKAARDVSYDEWLRRLRRAHRTGGGGHPWIQLDAPQVLGRWAEHVPAERVHVVTVPPAGGPPTVLLERWCRVLGLDPAELVVPERPANTSLGRVQAEVLRRVNAGLPDDLRRRQVYGDAGKRWLSSRVLAAQDGRPIRVPSAHRAWCEQVAAEQVEAITAAGWDVVGDLDDLRPRDGAFVEADAEPTADEVADAAVAALGRAVALRVEDQGGAGRGTAPVSRSRGWRARLAGRFRRGAR